LFGRNKTTKETFAGQSPFCVRKAELRALARLILPLFFYLGYSRRDAERLKNLSVGLQGFVVTKKEAILCFLPEQCIYYQLLFVHDKTKANIDCRTVTCIRIHIKAAAITAGGRYYRKTRYGSDHSAVKQGLIGFTRNGYSIPTNT
jgi:hypothetical protein